MSSIGNFSNSLVNAAHSAACAAKPLGKFEANTKQYGPAVATAISVADTVGDAASAVYHFSEKSLQELAKLPGEAYDMAKDAVGTVGKAIDAVEDGVEDAAHEVVSLASKGIRQIESAYDTVEHVATSVGKASNVVSDAVSAAVKDVGGAAATVAGYTALGLGAAASRITDLI